MDVLMLSRLQFAVATYFHFLFVPLTLGLSTSRHHGNPVRHYQRYGIPKDGEIWGKIFLINFVIGL